jgi:hypothetical protein
MKKKWLIIILTLIFVFTLIPLSYLSAGPNLVTNGDFSASSSNWDYQNAQFDGSTVSLKAGSTTAEGDHAWVYQEISSRKKDCTFSFDVYPTLYCGDGVIWAGFALLENGVLIDPPEWAAYDYGQTVPLDTWSSVSFKINQLWKDAYGSNLPDFDAIAVFVQINPRDVEATFDNIQLICQEGAAKEDEAVIEPEGWVRGDRDMVCHTVFVNDDGCFEFVFWYEYADNNHVMIYDEDGNEVFAIDMPYGKASFEACLADGTYTVKTFHTDMSTPLQEFAIGK